MATYVIGDVQGCYESLLALLKKVNFSEDRDRIWFTGDLVNRGPGSLEVLTWAFRHRHQVVTVLGNHDIHLLAISEGVRSLRDGDTLAPILEEKPKLRDKMMAWLRSRDFFFQENGYGLVHAGLHPEWGFERAAEISHRISEQLTETPESFLETVFEKRNRKEWEESRKIGKQLAQAVVVFTRMRFLDTQGNLEYNYKGHPRDAARGLSPWFEAWEANQKTSSPQKRLFFGHWAALGYSKTKHTMGLDTGCVWGGSLSAYCLETAEMQTVGARD